MGVDQLKELRESFQQMADGVGGVYSETDHNASEILKGSFSYQNHFGGLSTHVSHATELKNAKHFVELPPCLSFNILFEGQVDIALAHQPYQLGNVASGSTECSAIVAPQSEILTRQMKQGMKVCKLNVFVERAWLEARCHSQQDSALISKLFSFGTFFSSWEASVKCVELARELMEKEGKCETFYDKINVEQLTIALLLNCLTALELDMVKKQREVASAKEHILQSKPKLKQKIDMLMHSNFSLIELAKAMNMSVSTLQRKFKNQYGTTVSDYCQKKRLEIAKRAIFIDGISIGEAAYLAGYKHTSNFISAFKKRFDVTPAVFIAQYKGRQLLVNK